MCAETEAKTIVWSPPPFVSEAMLYFTGLP
jgi:hypothetical protein